MSKRNDSGYDEVQGMEDMLEDWLFEAGRAPGATGGCCQFHRSGGTRELCCGGDTSSSEGRHSRRCSVMGGGDCTCGAVAPDRDDDDQAPATPEQLAALERLLAPVTSDDGAPF